MANYSFGPNPRCLRSRRNRTRDPITRSPKTRDQVSLWSITKSHRVHHCRIRIVRRDRLPRRMEYWEDVQRRSAHTLNRQPMLRFRSILMALKTALPPTPTICSSPDLLLTTSPASTADAKHSFRPPEATRLEYLRSIPVADSEHPE